MKCLIRVVQFSMGSCQNVYAFRTATTETQNIEIFLIHVLKLLYILLVVLTSLYVNCKREIT